MADLMATYGVTITPDRWQAEVNVCRQLLDAWFEHRIEYVHPERLLNGSDLMTALNLTPGPQIGVLLEAIRETQAAGEIFTREQALDFARERLANQHEG
jgi:hypothetical protein